MSKQFLFGKWNESSAITVESAQEILRLARENEVHARNISLGSVFELFEILRKKWTDPQYPKRIQLLKQLPAVTHSSTEMVKLGLDEIDGILNPTLLKQKLETELGVFRKNPQLNISPLGTVLHIISGNVFLAGLGSWIEGILTHNVNILKLPSNETMFLPLFIETIQEVAPQHPILKTFALVDYASSQKEVMAVFKKAVDGIVIWGGEEAVQSYRSELPARTRCIVFGPKYSFGLITQEGLSDPKLIEKFALDVSLWDQRACTAPQICFVEGRKNAEEFAKNLSVELSKVAKRLPAGKPDLHSAIEVQRHRHRYEILEAKNLGKTFFDVHNVDYSVFATSDKECETSPLFRTAKIAWYENLEEVTQELRRLRGYLQTAGIACSQTEFKPIFKELEQLGILRAVPIGSMNLSEIDEPHDGQYDLPQLVHIQSQRVFKEAEKDLLNSSFLTLIQQARKSEFYRKRLNEKNLKTVEDLAQIPLLTRDEMEKNMPPQGNALCTLSAGESHTGGYVARSGGSTGNPKFSLYDGRDWEAMISSGVDVLKACGLEKGDRLANCFLAGDLYGSFVSFDHINVRIGVQTFALAGQVNPELFLSLWKDFKLNAIQSLPSVVLPLFRVLKQIEPSFTFEKIIYGGSPLSKSDQQWLVENIKPKRISSIIGANDGGQIGYQCEYLAGNLHHTVDEFNYIEIVDDHGNLVEGETPGQLVITSLQKLGYPLIRYALGDQASWAKADCQCGSGRRVFRFLGRADDTICLGNMNIKFTDIKNALEDFNISALQMVGKNDNEGEYLLLRVESPDRNFKLKNLIQDRLLEKVTILKRQVQLGHLNRIEIEMYASGDLPRNPRSGKIKAVSDERI